MKQDPTSKTQTGGLAPHEIIEPLAVRLPDACRMIGIGRSKLYELIATGKIQTVKLGKRRLVVVASLKAIVENCSGRAG